jgi:hypothetical protein
VQNPQVLEAMAGAADKNIDANVPRYFVESLKFPYMEGLRLCIEGYRRGGWKELDKMDANPPRSTREVLHPGDYFARLERGAQGTAFDNATLLTASRTLTVEHLGEFHWRYLAEVRWNSEERARAFRDAYVAFLHERGVAARAAVEGERVRIAYGADDALIAKFLGTT